MLVMIRCPETATPERREVHGGEFTIGRGNDNEWVISDPERHLSKKHCRVCYSMGDWELYDLSTNGTYLNHASDPIGRGIAQKLHHGDRITFGLYEIEVQIEGEAEAPSDRADFLTERPQSEFMREPPSRSNGPFGDIGLSRSDLALDAPNAPILPPDFDPLAPSPESFQGPTDSDHAPALHSAFRPPQPVIPDDWDAGLPNTSRPRPAPAPPAGALPENWDAEPPAASQPRSAPQSAPPAAAVPENWDAEPPGAARPQPATPPAPPSAAVPENWDADVPAKPRPRPAPTVAMPSASVPDDWDAGLPSTPRPPTAPSPSRSPPTEISRSPREAKPAPPPARAAPPPPSPRPAAPPPSPAPASPTADAEAAPTGDLAAAFMRGAGLGEATLNDPEKTLERIGAAIRATVSGLRQTLMARASIKDEFRIAQTVIRASGNNPLKFSLDDDDALATLLGTGRRGSMPPEEAIAEAFHDLRLHELATISAMQAAVRTLLEQFAPEVIERKGDHYSLLPGQNKARAWDAFAQQHKAITQALSDDFDSVFGKAFARAYEQAIDQLAGEGKAS